MECPRCKQVMLEKHGITICKNWQCWDSKPGRMIQDGENPFVAQVQSLGQNILNALESHYPFLRDSVLVTSDESPDYIFAVLINVTLDVLWSTLDPRVRDITTREQQRAFFVESVSRCAEHIAILRGSESKMASTGVPKAVIN